MSASGQTPERGVLLRGQPGRPRLVGRHPGRHEGEAVHGCAGLRLVVVHTDHPVVLTALLPDLLRTDA